MSITSGLRVELRQRRLDHRGELAVGDQHFGLAVLEDEGDRVGIEADIERVQHRARHRHAEMRLEQLGRVGCHHGDGVVLADAAPLERAREAAAAAIGLGPIVAARAVHDREPVGMDGRGADQEIERRQRHEIRRVAVEPGRVRGRSSSSPPGPLTSRRDCVARPAMTISRAEETP